MDTSSKFTKHYAKNLCRGLLPRLRWAPRWHRRQSAGLPFAGVSRYQRLCEGRAPFVRFCDAFKHSAHHLRRCFPVFLPGTQQEFWRNHQARGQICSSLSPRLPSRKSLSSPAKPTAGAYCVMAFETHSDRWPIRLAHRGGSRSWVPEGPAVNIVNKRRARQSFPNPKARKAPSGKKIAE